MRARAALAALLLWAAPALATTYDVMLVVSRPPLTSEMSIPANVREATKKLNRNLTGIKAILDYAGTNYGVIREDRCKTLWVKTGIFGRGSFNPTSGLWEQADSARCVIVTSFRAASCGNMTGTPRLDSLTRLAYTGGAGVNVPVLFIMDQASSGDLFQGGFSQGMDDCPQASLACSSGVYTGPIDTGPVGWPYLKSDPTVRWGMISYSFGWPVNPSPPAGGLRVVVGSAGIRFLSTSASQGGINEQFPASMPTLDSAGVSAGRDTARVWDRLWNIATLPNAKTMTFVQMSGGGYDNTDSLANIPPASEGTPGEFGFDILLAGMCHFDSLTLANNGRRLIFGNMKKPRMLALTVDGGLARSLRYYGYRPGIDPRDTTSFYSTLDSLKAHGIPVTFGVNVDSASSYQRDIIKLREVGLARFTPQVWTGCVGDTLLYGTAGINQRRFVDIFGQHRNRAFVGDGTGLGADTSIATKLRKARLVVDSLFPGRVSRFLMAPNDDYSPKQMRKSQNSSIGGSYSYAESLLYAAYTAGFRSMRVDGKYTDADPAVNTTNPRGWFTQSQWKRIAINGERFALLAHSGFELSGGVHYAWSAKDSVAPQDSSTYGQGEHGRCMVGMWDIARLNDSDVQKNPGPSVPEAYTWRDVQWRFEDSQSPEFDYSSHAFYAPCRVMRLACSDLSGRQPDPSRNGWLQIPFIDSWFKACNMLAGKTIMKWAYPEDIEP